MKKRIIAILVAAVIFCLAFTACSGDKATDGNAPSGSSSNEAGVFGEFESFDMKGKKVDNTALQGKKLTMVNAWATFCGPCISEMPDLQEISKEYAKKDFRIRVIHKNNEGLSSARNYGMDISYGQFIYFLDGDDYIKPSLIDTCAKAMVKYKADMCVFKTERVTPKGTVPFGHDFEWGLIDIEDDVVKYNFLFNKFLTYQYGWEAWNRMYKADIIIDNELAFFNEKKVFAEDLLFTLCYLLYTKKIMCIPTVLHSYVDREESLMNEKKEKIMIEEFNQLAGHFKDELIITDLSYCKRNVHRLYERIMYWHYGYLFTRVGIKEMRPYLCKIAITETCVKQTYKLLADKKNTVKLYGREDAIRRNGFYRFILKDNLFAYRMNGLLVKLVRLFKIIKR